MENEIYIIKRDGRREKLDINKIRKYTASAVEGLNNVTQSELEVSCKLLFKDGMTSEEIQKALIKTAVDKIDIDSTEWTFVAARLFLYDLYHRVTGTSGYDHLVKHFERCEKENRITIGLKDLYDLEMLNSAIDPKRDLQFNYLGIRTIHDRYLIKDSQGKVIELPQYMFMGIAMFLAQDEEDRNEKAIEFYNVISKFEVMLATPTLSNARTPRHQLSSCYVGSMPDSIEGIFDAYKEMALLSKFGGGIGWDVSKIRGIGSFIDGHKNAAGGVIPFLKITNDLAIAVDQLGCVAENSFVKILDKVLIEHNCKEKIIRYCDSYRKFHVPHYPWEVIVSRANEYLVQHSDFTVDQILRIYKFHFMAQILPRSQILDYIGIVTVDQYKRIIRKFNRLDKELPEGFKRIGIYNGINLSNYAINEDGYVINCRTFKFLTLSLNAKGYYTVSLLKDTENDIKIPVHRLVYKVFKGDIGDKTVDHIDGDKLNNNINNLQLLTNSFNISKGWQDNHIDRRIKSRLTHHLTSNKELNGYRSEEDKLVIKEMITKVVPISDVRVGDLILSFNIEKGIPEYKKVLKTYKLEVAPKNQIRINFEDGNYITTSKWHPMCIKKGDIYTYVRSDTLKPGDIGVGLKGEIRITSIDMEPNISKKYRDLTVQDNENYFCSTDNEEGNFYVTHNTRKGAIATYLEVWHKDMPEFVELRKNSGEERRRTHDLFPAVWICDLFMKRVEENADWSLFDPYLVPELTELYGEEFEKKYSEYEKDTTIPRETLPAKELWKKILLNYFETGLPFLGFKDTANRANPNQHTGLIRSSNLCFTGDTLVAVHDPLLNYEKKTMSIRKLAELSKGKESYTVYSAKEEKHLFGSWKKEVKNAIAFKTGTKEVVRVVLNNGFSFRCTPDHQLALMDGTYREAINCKGCLLEPFVSDYSQTSEILYEVKEIIRTGEVEDVYDLTVEDNHNFYIMYNEDIGVLVHNCTEIFQNTEPNHYQIEIEYEDNTKEYYEEEDNVQIVVKHTGEVTSIPAKKVTSIHMVINQEGILKKVYHSKRFKTDGQTAVCNLASVNLSKINKKEDIERVIPTAIRMLDNVISLNFYPDRKPKSTNEITRAIGLGVMGEAEFLATNEIMFGTEEHFNKINELMEAISYNAILASSNLAIERGSYSTFKDSLWAQGVMPHDHTPEGTRELVDYHETLDWESLREKVKKDGMRNGYLMAVAPTSSISILVGTTQTIEPVYKRKWFEDNLSGMIPVVVPNLKLETWNYYVSAYDVDQKDIIRAGAIRQKWIDQGQSLNLFVRVDENASIRRLHEIYTLAWKLGIKSTYYLRSESPEAKEDIVDRSMECQNCQ